MALAAPLSFANAQTELATITSQTANFTFTSDELTSALTQAWMDGYVVAEKWDSSLTYSQGTYIYTVPATLRTVKEIAIILPANSTDYVPPGAGNYPGTISKDLWEVIDGSIHFRDITQLYFADSYTLYLKGNYKLQTTDSLPTENLCLYVLWLAADNLMQMLLLKSAFVFLRNDTSLQAIVAASKITSMKVLEMKQRLPRGFESAS